MTLINSTDYQSAIALTTKGSDAMGPNPAGPDKESTDSVRRPTYPQRVEEYLDWVQERSAELRDDLMKAKAAQEL